MTDLQLQALRDSKKVTGDLGEDFALAYEQQRLAGHPQLSKVIIAGRHDIGLGYDISSFEGLTSTAIDRYIEVKTYSGNPHFFLSQGEWAAATKHGSHYYIYLVDQSRIGTPGYAPIIIQDPAHRLAANENWSENIQQREYTLAAPQEDPLPDGFDSSTILIGCFKDNPHLNWIRHYRKYNVRKDIVQQYHKSPTNPPKQTGGIRPMSGGQQAKYSAQSPTNLPKQTGGIQPMSGGQQVNYGAQSPTNPPKQDGGMRLMSGDQQANYSAQSPTNLPKQTDDTHLRDLEVIPRRPIPGAITPDEIGLGVRYLLLYNVCEPRSYRTYTVQSATLASNAYMRSLRYPNPRCPAYVLYTLSGVIDLPAIDIMSVLRSNNDKVTRTSGTPIFMSGKALRQYFIDGTAQRMTGAPAPKRIFTNEGKPWSTNQSMRLEALASMHKSIAEIAHEMKRTPAEIHARLHVLGLE